jgi:hypothetical protein
MDSQAENRCPQCQSHLDPGHPFCIHCGELSGPALSLGSFLLEIQDVPSDTTRGQAVAILKSWFPEMDALRAHRMLRDSPTILVNGVDEGSANRLLRALLPLKVRGRILGPADTTWWKLVWNPGLLASVPAVVAAWGLDGAASVAALIVAVAAPAVGALLARSRSQPLIRQESLHSLSGEWLGLAKDYSETIRLLSPEDSAVLTSIAGKVFDLHGRLKNRSLPAAAAGAEMGHLHKVLTDTIRTAVEIGRKIARRNSQDKDGLRQDLASLNRLVEETEVWYTSLETRDHKQVPELAAELEEITAGIDKIVREVRDVSEERLIVAERARLLE